MQGNPAYFEAIGNRLGFHVAEESREKLILVWQGARFPAFLCLGIALALLFLSVPILEAIHQKGFTGPAGSLWYFPIMNLVLLGIAFFLLSVKRTISVDSKNGQVTLTRRTLFRSFSLSANYDEVAVLRLGIDEVYSGFAVAGSSAAQRYPASALRLILKTGETVLLDRGGRKRLEGLGKNLSRQLGKPFEADKALQP